MRWCGEGVGSEASGVPAGGCFGVGEQVQQLADGPLAQESLGQGLVDLDAVAVAAAVFVFEYVPGLYEVGDDAECGAFGDAERAGDFPQAHPWVLGDAQQGLCVVGEEPPSHNGDLTHMWPRNLEINC